MLEYLGSDGADVAGDMIGAVWESAANLAVAPMQDFLRLGEEARMNTPGVPAGNWSWRLDALPDEGLAAEIRALNELTGRA